MENITTFNRVEGLAFPVMNCGEVAGVFDLLFTFIVS
jgi:hypothetical protein